MGISKFGQKLTLFFILNIENNMNILIDNWSSIICNTDKKVMELLIERHNIVCIVKAAVTSKSVNYAHFWCPNGRLGLSQKKKYPEFVMIWGIWSGRANPSWSRGPFVLDLHPSTGGQPTFGVAFIYDF